MKDYVPMSVIPSIFADKWASLLNGDKMTKIYDNNLSVYIHYPFCRQKCAFCQIATIQYNSEMGSSYVSLLTREIIQRKEILSSHSIDCIHFGGGTPSLMDAQDVEDILKTINKYTNIKESEIVFEAHPFYMSDNFLSCLSNFDNCTINFGVQSFDDAVLTSVNRNYKTSEILKRIEWAKSKVRAIGIDIICDLPNSTQDTLKNDIKHISMLQSDHISLYPLIIQNTPMTKNEKYLKNCKNIILNIDEKIDINTSCAQMLSDLGYNRYSIYHYEKEGILTHIYGRNQINNGKWIGFGSKAYTYLGDITYINTSIEDYMKGFYIHKKVEMNFTDRLIWELSFLIRRYPLNQDEIYIKYGIILKPYIEKIIAELVKKDFMTSKNNLELTWKGVMNITLIEQIIKEVMSSKISVAEWSL